MKAQQIESLKLLEGRVQDTIPYWQRRYCWRKADIERLIEDLMAIVDADTNSNHYAGNLLTFAEPKTAGTSKSKTFRVVDGQQRLTTVSLLLACIAEKLEHEVGKIPLNYISETISNQLLTSGGCASYRRSYDVKWQTKVFQGMWCRKADNVKPCTLSALGNEKTTMSGKRLISGFMNNTKD